MKTQHGVSKHQKTKRVSIIFHSLQENQPEQCFYQIFNKNIKTNLQIFFFYKKKCKRRKLTDHKKEWREILGQRFWVEEKTHTRIPWQPWINWFLTKELVFFIFYFWIENTQTSLIIKSRRYIMGEEPVQENRDSLRSKRKNQRADIGQWLMK